MAANWSGVEIATSLSIEDFFAFRRVCTSWRSDAVLEGYIHKKHLCIPLLMLAPSPAPESSHSFFHFSGRITSEFILPEANDKKYFSSQGWLITIAKDLSMSLLHPFTRLQMELPHLNTSGEENIYKYQSSFGVADLYVNLIDKCVLSSSPSDSESDYIVMIIFDNHKLAYYKSGDHKAWKTITPWFGAVFDIIYDNEKRLFYAVDTVGNVKAVDVRCNNPIVTHLARLPRSIIQDIYQIESAYMVQVSAEVILLILRFGVFIEDDDEYGTYSFQVFKLELDTPDVFTRVNSLGNKAVFLGHNSSFLIQVLDATKQCEPNCIYFTDDCVESYFFNASYPQGGGKDMGIYNMKDRSFESFFDGESYHRITPPMWVEQRL